MAPSPDNSVSVVTNVLLTRLLKTSKFIGLSSTTSISANGALNLLLPTITFSDSVLEKSSISLTISSSLSPAILIFSEYFRIVSSPDSLNTISFMPSIAFI